MRRATVGVVIAIALTASACGAGGGGTRARRTVTSALNRVSSSPYFFVYKEILQSPKMEIVVTGSVSDDLRQQATMQIDGHDVIEHVISDDAIAVRVLDVKRAGRYIAEVLTQDSGAGKALVAGKWIVDHQGAPDLIAPRTGENSIQVGTNPMLDATTYLFQYLEDAMNDSRGMFEWNPDSVNYNPLDDPWRDDADANLVDQGIRRFEIAQPPLPRPTQRGSEGALANTLHFRKLTFYLHGDDVTTVKEQIKIDDRQEFRRSKAGRAAKYFQELLARSLAGATREPIRQRNLEVTFEPTDVSIELPKSDFESVPALDLVSGVGALVPQTLPGGRVGFEEQGLTRGSPSPASTGAPATGGPAPEESE